jgi:RNA polymerase sigma-70 factor (ECF subfamily)
MIVTPPTARLRSVRRAQPRARRRQASRGLPHYLRCARRRGLSTAEAADCLDIPEETVKTRLHRARSLLRQSLSPRLGEAAKEAFPFGFAHCDRVVADVLARITTLGPPAAA